MDKVCLFNVYFGELPHWMDFFIQSANHNKGHHFYVFNDKIKEDYQIGNVFVKKIDKSQISEIISHKFGRKYELTNVRKLCDWKTVYGRIFSEISANYDFWGHCDLDIVWGDIDKFLGIEDYEKYDIISGDINRLCGPYNLFKVSKYLDVYNLHGDWEDILFNRPHVAYDEIGLDWAVKNQIDLETVLFGIGKNGIKMQNYGSPTEKPPLRIPAVWRNGELTIMEDNRDTMFIHMGFKRKMKKSRFTKENKFYITEEGMKYE
jgi:hypothetical protein